MASGGFSSGADSDWDHQTVLRKQHKPSDAKSAAAVNSALRSGAAVVTTTKFGAAGNRQHTTAKDTARLDEETEELRHEKVSMSVGKAIMQGRNAKGLTQKDLATKINEKPTIINDYEQSRVIPNDQILSKIERIIGLKLRGKDIGCPFPPPGGKK